MSAPADRPVHFAAFELSLRTGELRKGGVRIALADQPFQVLKALLERPGELVTREELRHRLWPDDTFVDFDQGLNAAVRRLREALGDSADVPRFVETLPKRGYRLIVPVADPVVVTEAPVRPSSAPPGQPGAESPVVIETRRSRRWRPLTAAVFLIAAVASIGWFGDSLRTPGPAALAPTGPIRLAVLPVRNLTGDAAQEHVADGLTEELITQLNTSAPSRLAVIASPSAMHYKNTTKRADEIGRDLNVAYLLVSSLRRDGDQAFITAQLVDVTSQVAFWTLSDNRDASNVAGLQRLVGGDVTRQVTRALGLEPAGADSESGRHSTNGEAVKEYLIGRVRWSRGTRAELDAAKGHFERALELDPSYALAYSGLADTYMQLAGDGFLPMPEAYQRARDLARTALDLNGELAAPHAALGGFFGDYAWNWMEAERHFSKALALEPNNATTNQFYSRFLSLMRRHAEAVELGERARRLDPMSPSAWMNRGVVYYFKRDYVAAAAAFEDLLEIYPGVGAAHVMLGRVHAARGEHDQAIAAVLQARERMGDRPDVVTPLAYVLAKAGRHDDLLAQVETLRRIARPRQPSPFRLAYVNVALGRTDEALALLREAVKARDWQLTMLNVEPAFDGLRHDQRFAAILEQVGLAHAGPP